MTAAPAYAAAGLSQAELVALADEASTKALSDPATMALYLDPKFALRPHLRLLADEISAVATGHTKRLMIMIPPQTGKSTLAAVWTPFWWLARNPSQRVIIGSYGQTLAMHRGRAIRRAVELHGWQWDLALAYGSRQTADWALETGGGIKSVGVGSGVTGSPADLLVLDDPHKSRAEADSRTKRDAVWDWYSADFLSRLAPGGPVIAMLTPWHEDDWAHRALAQDGRAEDGGDWRVVRLPAFADTDDDPLGRAYGDPLPHPLIPEHDTASAAEHWSGRRRQSTPRDWGALYQLDPKPAEGALIDRDALRQMRYIPPPADPVKTVVAVDPSGEGRDLAGVVGGFLGDDNRVYITRDASVHEGADGWSRAAALLAAELDADYWVVEANGALGKHAVRMLLSTAWESLKAERPDDAAFQRLKPQIKAVHARKGKLLRAEPVVQQMHEDVVRLGALMPELEEEWATWQPTDSESPGRIDASTYLAYSLVRVPDSHSRVSVATGVGKSAVATGRGPRIERRR